jgi:hypothetical protein
MFKLIISSIFIFIVICILILLLISFTTTNNNNKNKEKFTTTEIPVLNVELIKYPPNAITNVSGVNTRNGFYFQTFQSTNGNYTIAYSTIWGYNWYNLELLFNTDTKITNGGAHFQTTGYNTNSGEHNANIRFPFIANAKQGDWLLIILPTQTKLKRYGFVAREALIGRAPGKWDLYGTNSSSNLNNISSNSRFTLIDTNQERLNESDYTSEPTNLTYVKRIHSNEGLFDTYLFIFNTAANSNVNRGANYMINFQQLLLFGT